MQGKVPPSDDFQVTRGKSTRLVRKLRNRFCEIWRFPRDCASSRYGVTSESGEFHRACIEHFRDQAQSRNRVKEQPLQGDTI